MYLKVFSVTIFLILLTNLEVANCLFGRNGSQKNHKSHGKSNCINNIIKNTNTTRIIELSKCFDVSELQKVKNESGIAEDFVKGMPDSCRNLASHHTFSNFLACFEYINSFVNDKTDVIGKFVHAFFDGSKACIDVIQARFNGLEGWIKKGCP